MGYLPTRFVRIAVASLMSLAFLAGVSGVFASAHPASQVPLRSSPIAPTRTGQIALKGVVDLRKARAIQPGDTLSNFTPPITDHMTPKERAAYEANARKGIGVPLAPAISQRPANSGSLNPSFVGGGVIPLLVKNYEGLSSTQTGGAARPDPAIATDLSYVMEAVNGGIGIYRASTGALAYGPYTPDSFFAPVKQAGSTFGSPQLYYDVMRDHWIVMYEEFETSGDTNLDFAISVSNSPTQPSPGAQYYEYQFGMGAAPNTCESPSLGVEYYSLTVTCKRLFNGSAVGNWVTVFNKAPMLSGQAATNSTWLDPVPSDVALCNGLCPSLNVSPAIEEGVQDAEFLVGTSAWYGGTHTSVALCAITNLRNIATTTPSLSCLLAGSISSYAEPIGAVEFGGGTLDVGRGVKGMYYKAGNLFVAFTSSFNGPQDGVVWMEIHPELNESTPQAMGNYTMIRGGVQSLGPNNYLYTPTLMGTDEDDLALVYYMSNNANNPWLIYTGRKSSDQGSSMGQGSGGGLVVRSTYAHSSPWGANTACAIPLNSVTRGTIWCVGEYAGSVADPGWNTRLFSVRVD